MDGIALNNQIPISMPNTKERKKKTMNAIKAKLEKAKLDLLYTELEEMNVPFERNYETVNELLKDLKGKVSDLTFNNIQKVVEKIETSLNTMVKDLEKGSTNAFTKLMTSDITKTIGKTLGISLAGRTALLLAPTLTSKAIIGAGLAGYGLYKIIKNRNEIKEINEVNELNNILQDLEVTKENDKYLDTRFDESTQEEIRKFLRDNKIEFEDTGYRSLRQAIYSLEKDKKRGLCELLNSKLGKGIEIEERIIKAKRKLNVIASSSAAISAGATLGIQLATTINAVDPGLVAGVLNGTVLAGWVESVVGKSWFTALSGGIGLVGSEVLQHIPVIGNAASNVFAAENLASFATIGAVGGLAVSATLGVASAIKSIHTNIVNKKETQEFLKLDNEKYGESDKPELQEIARKLHEPDNLGEMVIVDIVTGYLKDENISLNDNPKSVNDLKISIEKLQGDEKKKAQYILSQIDSNLSNDPEFIQKLKKAGKISICLFTSGLAAMSVYDIIKGGTFLPEVSKKLFPENNIYNPVDVPKAIDTPYQADIKSEQDLASRGRKIYEEFSQKEYFVEKNGEYDTSVGYEIGKYNHNISGVNTQRALVDSGLTQNLTNNILNALGIGQNSPELVPNIPLIAEKINSLSPEELYAFYRYVNSLSDQSEMLDSVKLVLGYETFLNKVTNYIGSFEKSQHFNEMVADVSKKIMTGAIPFSTGLSILGIERKKETSSKYGIDDKEVENSQENTLGH